MYLYRMIHEEGSIFWEEILSVIVREKNSYKHVPDCVWLPRYSCVNL